MTGERQGVLAAIAKPVSPFQKTGNTVVEPMGRTVSLTKKHLPCMARKVFFFKSMIASSLGKKTERDAADKGKRGRDKHGMQGGLPLAGTPGEMPGRMCIEMPHEILQP